MVRFDKDNRLLHGGDYNPEQWLEYPEILKKDFEMMKLANVNTVTVGMFSWSELEPREGEYKFDWLDEVFDKMYDFGGNVILATPSGGRPQWLSEKYPEVNRTNNIGQKHTHGFRHNHCYSSPIYRLKVENINRKLAERYGNHPALSMWHISNEYSGECYCDLCKENWKKWLKKKYSTLDNINDKWLLSFWGNKYSDWKQVLPPSPLGEHKVHGMDLDWKRFVTDMTIDFFLSEIEPIKEITPNVPITTNFMAEGHDTNDFIPLEGINYKKFSDYLDVVSWDSYPNWNNNYESLASTAMKAGYVHDFYWSLKKQPFLVMESTPSTVNWHQFNKAKKPGIHILSSMQQIAHGSDSTLYFQWRQSRGNSEKFHGAVVGSDNSIENRVFKEVSKYGERLSKINEIKNSTKRNKVAIVYEYESNWTLNRGGGFGRPTKRYQQTLQKHYNIFWENDIGVDIISLEDSFDNYDLIIAPMLYMIAEDEISKLEEYVTNGGTLISSYFTGYVDKYDLLHQGGWPIKLQKIFGIDRLELVTLFPDEHNSLKYQNKLFQVKDYADIIKPYSANVLATYKEDYYKESPALVENNYGDGKAYYFSARSNKDFLTDFYRNILENLKLQNPILFDSIPEVSIQTRSNNEHIYYFFMNFTEESHKVNIKKDIMDLETGKCLSGNIKLKPYEVIITKTNK